MRLSLVAVGGTKADAYTPLIDDYEARIRHYAAFSARTLKTHGDTPGAVAQEGAEILRVLPPGHVVITLDRAGKALDTAAFAAKLGMARNHSRDAVFVIGGPAGLAPAAIRAADEVLSLGPMTLPHRLARLILTEQIYRACTILAGEKYHK